MYLTLSSLHAPLTDPAWPLGHLDAVVVIVLFSALTKAPDQRYYPAPLAPIIMGTFMISFLPDSRNNTT